MLAHPGLRSLAGSDSETSVPSPWPPRSVPCNPLAAVLTQEYFIYICAFSWELAHYNELNKMLINTKNTAWLQILLECLLRGGLSRWLCGKDPLAKAGDTRDMGSIPGSGRSRGVGNGNPLQYSCLENPMGRGAWWAIVHGAAKSWT